MKDYINPHLIVESSRVEPGVVSWKSPSNLALIKYWGKYDRQRPRNPSVSFTLDSAYTETRIEYGPREQKITPEIELEFFFDDQPHAAFKERLQKFLGSITDVYPFLKQLKLVIRSSNSFPHSAGIASSASAMSALALCLCSIEEALFQPQQDESSFFRKASFIARLASGSACRSVYPQLAFWGEHGEVADSSDYFAIPFEKEVHPVFKSFQNDILIVSKKEKSVSSSAGHALMEQHPYADTRYKQANKQIHLLIRALKNGEIEEAGRIIENEALTLHALMMASNPSYILLQPGTLDVIRLVRQFRKDTNTPLYFSLDAGPNPHLLYPLSEKNKVQDFIQNELIRYCDLERHISDQVGQGPQKIES
jgi:diphosphomevalonate decarboxylase